MDAGMNSILNSLKMEFLAADAKGQAPTPASTVNQAVEQYMLLLGFDRTLTGLYKDAENAPISKYQDAFDYIVGMRDDADKMSEEEKRKYVNDTRATGDKLCGRLFMLLYMTVAQGTQHVRDRAYEDAAMKAAKGRNDINGFAKALIKFLSAGGSVAMGCALARSLDNFLTTANSRGLEEEGPSFFNRGQAAFRQFQAMLDSAESMDVLGVQYLMLKGAPKAEQHYTVAGMAVSGDFVGAGLKVAALEAVSDFGAQGVANRVKAAESNDGCRLCLFFNTCEPTKLRPTQHATKDCYLLHPEKSPSGRGKATVRVASSGSQSAAPPRDILDTGAVAVDGDGCYLHIASPQARLQHIRKTRIRVSLANGEDRMADTVVWHPLFGESLLLEGTPDHLVSFRKLVKSGYTQVLGNSPEGMAFKAPDGKTVHFHFDKDGLLARVDEGTGKVAAVQGAEEKEEEAAKQVMELYAARLAFPSQEVMTRFLTNPKLQPPSQQKSIPQRTKAQWARTFAAITWPLAKYQGKLVATPKKTGDALAPRPTRAGEVLHGDIVFSPARGARHVWHFAVDGATNLVVLTLISNKAAVIHGAKATVALYASQGIKVGMLSYDAEAVLGAMAEPLGLLGVELRQSTPGDHERFAERAWRSVCAIARTLWKQATVLLGGRSPPLAIMKHALLHAAWIHNRLPHKQGDAPITATWGLPVCAGDLQFAFGTPVATRRMRTTKDPKLTTEQAGPGLVIGVAGNGGDKVLVLSLANPQHPVVEERKAVEPVALDAAMLAHLDAWPTDPSIWDSELFEFLAEAPVEESATPDAPALAGPVGAPGVASEPVGAPAVEPAIVDAQLSTAHEEAPAAVPVPVEAPAATPASAPVVSQTPAPMEVSRSGRAHVKHDYNALHSSGTSRRISGADSPFEGVGEALATRTEGPQTVAKLTYQSMLGEDRARAELALTTEIERLMRLGSFHSVYAAKVASEELRKAVGVLIVASHKTTPEGELQWRTRLVTRGDRQQLPPGTPVSASGLPFFAVLTVVALAALRGHSLAALDVTCAFPHAPLPPVDTGHKQLVWLPAHVAAVVKKLDPRAILNHDGRMLVEADKAMYGFRESPLLFSNFADKVLLEAGLEATSEPCVFAAASDDVVAAKHVDDLMCSL